MLLMTERNGFSYLAPVLYALVHRMLYGLACCSSCRFMDVCVICLVDGGKQLFCCKAIIHHSCCSAYINNFDFIIYGALKCPHCRKEWLFEELSKFLHESEEDNLEENPEEP